MFPFFSAFLGWLGVFLTGSDTSANALFGSLQVITANRLGLDPVLMAATNSAGGVMGKMISLQTHRSRRGRDRHVGRGPDKALSIHPEAKHSAGERHRRTGFALCVWISFPLELREFS